MSDIQSNITNTLDNMEAAKAGFVRASIAFIFAQRIEVVLLVGFIVLMVLAAWVMCAKIIPDTFDKVNAGYAAVWEKQSEALKVQAEKHSAAVNVQAEAAKAQAIEHSKDIERILSHSEKQHAEHKEFVREILDRVDRVLEKKPIAVGPVVGGS